MTIGKAEADAPPRKVELNTLWLALGIGHLQLTGLGVEAHRRHLSESKVYLTLSDA